MGSGYGTPDTEFTIWQMLPDVASGMPPAVAMVWVTATITPESGGPAAPGLSTTAHPIETGGPGIGASPSRRRELRHPAEADLRGLQRHLCLRFERGLHGLERQRALRLDGHVARRAQLEVALRLQPHLALGLDDHVALAIHHDGGLAQGERQRVVADGEGDAARQLEVQPSHPGVRFVRRLVDDLVRLRDGRMRLI